MYVHMVGDHHAYMILHLQTERLYISNIYTSTTHKRVRVYLNNELELLQIQLTVHFLKFARAFAADLPLNQEWASPSH